MHYILILAVLICQACLGQTSTIEGTWSGNLKFGGAELPFIIHVVKEQGEWKAHAESPKQGVNYIPAKVSIKKDSVFFDISGGIQVKGLFKGAEIDAIFSQAGMKLPLLLKLENKGEVANSKITRPQEPKPPYGYDTVDVHISNTIDGVELAGTMTIPKGDGKYPAVILVSGSGPQDRDETLFGHKPFKVLADYLTTKGIVVLRYDDRGVGNSKGNFAKSTIEDFSKDAVAAFQYLGMHDKVDKNKMGIIGHSEGGLIALLLAGQGLPHLSFIGMLAGPAIAIDSLMVDQLYAIGKASGMNVNQLEKAKKINTTNFQIVKSTMNTEDAYTSLVRNMGIAVQGNQMEAMKGELMSMLTPAYRYFLRIDPKQFIPHIYIPVFAAYGSLDVQVPAKPNISSLKQSLPLNTKTVLKEYDGLNHLFQQAKTGLVQEYAEIEHSMDQQVLEEITNWIKNL